MTGSDRTSYAIGFADLDAEASVDSLPVKGEFPRWLSGALVRTGPAKFDLARQTVNHWFDGLAMLHRFGFDDGRVSYRNRFLRSRTFCDSEANGRAGCRAGSRPIRAARCSNASPRSSPRPTPTTATSTSICSAASRSRSLRRRFPSASMPRRWRRWATRDTARMSAGRSRSRIPTTTPPADAASATSSRSAAKSRYRLFAIPDDGSPERVIAEMPVDRPAYMHSFAMTERYLVLTEFPLVVDPLRMLLAAEPFIRNYRWEPERGLRFHVFEKDGGQLVKSLTCACGVRVPSRQRLRGGRRDRHRCHHSIPTRRSSISSTSSGCAPVRPSMPPGELTRYVLEPGGRGRRDLQPRSAKR